MMGAMFAGSECVIEKVRAKHDIYNSVYAGCATGGALAHKAGPKVRAFVARRITALLPGRSSSNDLS